MKHKLTCSGREVSENERSMLIKEATREEQTEDEVNLSN